MIKINNLTKKIEKNEILNSVSLDVKKGSVFGLLGSNGAGKSTLLRLISGIYKADSGEITINDQPVYDNPSVKEKIFFINDETVQFSEYTMKGLKDFYSSYYPDFSDEMFETLRKKTELPDDKKLSSFSKGMKRQAIVITGLACMTDVLILDEAFDGLDPAMRILVKNIIFDAVLDRQLTVIIASHNLREITEICDSAAMLHKGQIIFSHETESFEGICRIQAAFPEEYTKDDFPELDIVNFRREHSIYSITVRNNSEDIRNLLNPKNPSVLDIIPLTLEEIFICEMEAHGYAADENEE